MTLGNYFWTGPAQGYLGERVISWPWGSKARFFADCESMCVWAMPQQVWEQRDFGVKLLFCEKALVEGRRSESSGLCWSRDSVNNVGQRFFHRERERFHKQCLSSLLRQLLQCVTPGIIPSLPKSFLTSRKHFLDRKSRFQSSIIGTLFFVSCLGLGGGSFCSDGRMDGRMTEFWPPFVNFFHLINAVAAGWRRLRRNKDKYLLDPTT